MKTVRLIALGLGLLAAACQPERHVVGTLPETRATPAPAPAPSNWFLPETRGRSEGLALLGTGVAEGLEVRPLSGPVRVGHPDDVRMRMVKRTQVSGGNGDVSGAITLRSERTIRRDPDGTVVMVMRVSDVGVVGVHSDEADLKAMEGLEVTARLRRGRLVDISSPQADAKTLKPLEQVFALAGDLLLWGKTLRQGEVAQDIDLRKLLPGIQGVDGRMSLRVIGQGRLLGRPVVVLSGDGAISMAGGRVDMEFATAVDLETGVFLASGAEASAGGEQMRMIETEIVEDLRVGTAR